MLPLNITLPADVFKAVLTGEKQNISHKRNPRIDRYFAAKKPTQAKINGQLFKISKIVVDDSNVHIYIS